MNIASRYIILRFHHFSTGIKLTYFTNLEKTIGTTLRQCAVLYRRLLCQVVYAVDGGAQTAHCHESGQVGRVGGNQYHCEEEPNDGNYPGRGSSRG